MLEWQLEGLGASHSFTTSSPGMQFYDLHWIYKKKMLPFYMHERFNQERQTFRHNVYTRLRTIGTYNMLI